MKSFKYYFEKLGIDCPGVEINVVSNVPRSRGLGSSATCIVAGLMAANEYNGNKFDKYKILELATDIEGHPDNVLCGNFGGHTIAFGSTVTKVEVAKNLKFYALVPSFEMSTEESRNLVPEFMDRQSAVQNIAGVAMITNALRTGDLNLIINARKIPFMKRKDLK